MVIPKRKKDDEAEYRFLERLGILVDGEREASADEIELIRKWLSDGN